MIRGAKNYGCAVVCTTTHNRFAGGRTGLGRSHPLMAILAILARLIERSLARVTAACRLSGCITAGNFLRTRPHPHRAPPTRPLMAILARSCPTRCHPLAYCRNRLDANLSNLQACHALGSARAFRPRAAGCPTRVPPPAPPLRRNRLCGMVRTSAQPHPQKKKWPDRLTRVGPLPWRVRYARHRNGEAPTVAAR